MTTPPLPNNNNNYNNNNNNKTKEYDLSTCDLGFLDKTLD